MASLLRSVAVHESARGKGIGETLVAMVLARLKARNVDSVSLLTTTADTYFASRGFVRVNRSDLPAALGHSAELRGACPATAAVMLLYLRPGV